MRKVSTILFCLLLLGIASAQSHYSAQVDSAIALGLKCMLMKPGDLTFRNDYTEVDAERLMVINSLMADPKHTVDMLEDWSKKRSDDSGYTTIFSDDRYMTIFAGLNILKGKKTYWLNWSSKYGLFERTQQKVQKSEFERFNKKLKADKSERGLRDFYQSTFVVFRELSALNCRPAFIESISKVFRQSVVTILLEDVKDEFKSPAELDQQQKYEEGLSLAVSKEAEKFDDAWWIDGLSQEITKILRAAERLRQKSIHIPSEMREKYGRENEIVRKIETDLGEVIIGGYGSNSYKGSPALVIDLGGDDIYELSYDSTKLVQLIIDTDGNDLYKAETDFALGSGFFGAGILIDEEGDDTYLGKNFSLGSGLFGVGILIDKKGNDKYFGDTYTQGAGGWGIGILEDLEGSDSYNGALFSQGFGFVAGCGMLIDRSGSDNYFAGGKYKDILRYKDHYLSLSQGFAYGIRPYMSGGIGLLFDYSGNDAYNADIFGQGASYWWSWGGLYDKEGNDYYSCFQYAQGCGTHMTLGTLVDEAGDDIYRVNGVGQGCGHDYSAGILLDKAGNDNYYANGLSQGAGNANGFGILIDQAGDDGYYVKDKSNTQGYGNPRREFGSIGLFLDLKGKDSYSGNGSDGSWWSTGSKWGMGLDLEEGNLAEYLSDSDLNNAKAKSFPGPDLSSLPSVDWDVATKTVAIPLDDSLQKLVDSLFILASAINVSDMDKVEPAKQALRDMKENSNPYLVRKLDSRDAREIQTLIDILSKMGESAALPVASALKSDDIWTVRNAGRVLAELKDKQAVPYLLQALKQSDHQARGNAITAIGNAKDTTAFLW